jgi:hypothetical protein
MVKYVHIILFRVALRPNADYGPLRLEVSRSHSTTHHIRSDSSGRVISSSKRRLPDNTQNTHNRHTYMSSVGFETTNSAGERPQTHALDWVATGSGTYSWCWKWIAKSKKKAELLRTHHSLCRRRKAIKAAEYSPCKADTSSAAQEIPRIIIRNPKFQYDVIKKYRQLFSSSATKTHSTTLQFSFLKIHYNIILPSNSRFSKWSLSLRFPHQIPVCSLPIYTKLLQKGPRKAKNHNLSEKWDTTLYGKADRQYWKVESHLLENTSHFHYMLMVLY